MAIRDQQNQLNLTVVALVALVAIVGLVALVLNTTSLVQISTGSSLASAAPADNLAGSARSTGLETYQYLGFERGPYRVVVEDLTTSEVSSSYFYGSCYYIEYNGYYYPTIPTDPIRRSSPVVIDTNADGVLDTLVQAKKTFTLQPPVITFVMNYQISTPSDYPDCNTQVINWQ